MKALFYSSMMLPTIYVFTVLLFFVGLLFGFDLAEVIYPFNDLVFGWIAGLTFGYIAVCLALLWRSEQLRRTKVLWSALLLFGNMIAVPWFLWCYNHCSLRQALYPKEKTL
jgi:hypothetical protein